MFYNDKQKSQATYLPTQKQDAFLKRVVSFQKEKNAAYSHNHCNNKIKYILSEN